MKLPPLNALRFFDVAARTESFVEAAAELHVTHSAVSRQVRLLEDDLGVSLFDRRGRSIYLNKAGRELRQVTSRMFDELAQVSDRIRNSAMENVLTLSCEPTIAMRWLIPKLGSFQSACPDITLHLVAAGGAIDFRRTRVDIALRRNDFKWDDSVEALFICKERTGPVAAGAHASSIDNEDTVFLHTSSRLNAWPTWASTAGRSIKSKRNVTYEHFYLSIQAATAGLGVAIASFLMVQEDVAAGQLVAPHGFLEDGSAYYLLSPEPISGCDIRQRFANWLLREIRNNE